MLQPQWLIWGFEPASPDDRTVRDMAGSTGLRREFILQRSAMPFVFCHDVADLVPSRQMRTTWEKSRPMIDADTATPVGDEVAQWIAPILRRPCSALL